MRFHWLFVVVVCTVLSACVPSLDQTLTPTPSESAQPSQTFSPTEAATLTPVSSATIAPPPEQDFYRLRIEYSSTSDWTTLELHNPEGILAARLMETQGNPDQPRASITLMTFGQSLASAEVGQRVGITVDYAVDADAISQPLDFTLQKGNLNGSRVRFYLVSGDQPQLIQEVTHQGTVGTAGLNPLSIQVDLSSLADVAPMQATILRPDVPRMIWAFYYPWYRISDWSSPLLSDWPLTPYASSDPAVIRRHIEQAQSAGIDGFICSWWGPASDTDRNLVKILDIAQELDFSITIYFETYTGSGPLEQDVILDWLTYFIRSYRDHPAFMQVNGKPLIVFWVSGTVPLANWQEIFDELGTQGLDSTNIAMGYNIDSLTVFDGLHEYGVLIQDLAQVAEATGRAVRNYSLLADDPTPKMWIATIQPGYDDRLIPDREGLFQAREGGDFYRSTIEAAVGSDPDWIFVSTWNEWWEHTHIEPSQNFGELYLEITRDLAQEWKGQ